MRALTALVCSSLLIAAGCGTGDGDSIPRGRNTGDAGHAGGSGGVDGSTGAGGAGGGADSGVAGAGGQADAGGLQLGDAGQVACTDSIDVVFVLDVSSSMGFVLEQLSDEIDGVVEAATKLTQDGKATPPHFGLVTFVDNHVIDLGGAESDGAVHLDGDSLRKAFEFHRDFFTTPNRNPGDGPTGPTTQNPICEENALDALHATAKDFPWRTNASHVVILATDDTFLERPDNYGDRDGDGLTDKTNYPREGDYPALRTVPETVDAMKTAKIRLFAFTARGDAAHHCGTGRRLPWEGRADGWSAPYGSNPPLPESTDGANYDIELVRKGSLSLSDTINDIVLDTYCNPPIY